MTWNAAWHTGRLPMASHRHSVRSLFTEKIMRFPMPPQGFRVKIHPKASKFYDFSRVKAI